LFWRSQSAKTEKWRTVRSVSKCNDLL
jgi:hypothetical protein